MQIIPAIDLLDGRAVRLRQGRYDEVTVYSEDPAAFAAAFRGSVPRLHVVDLDGARAGRAVQRDLVSRIAESFGPGVQAGGGIRTRETADEYLALGVSRIVLGTAAIDDPELVEAIALAHPDRVIVALDARGGHVATHGWEKLSERSAIEVVQELERLPLAGVLYTDVERDGTEVGPNVAATAALARATRLPVIASGGVGTLEHIQALARAEGPISAAIVGRALFERRFTLEQALAAAESGSRFSSSVS